MKPWFILEILLGFGVGLWLYLQTPKSVVVSAKFWIDRDQPLPMGLDLLYDHPTEIETLRQHRQVRMNDLTAFLQSNAILNDTSVQLGMTQSELLEKLEFYPLFRSNIVEIHCRGTHYESAYKLCNTYLRNAEARYTPLVRSALNQRLKYLQKALEISSDKQDFTSQIVHTRAMLASNILPKIDLIQGPHPLKHMESPRKLEYFFGTLVSICVILLLTFLIFKTKTQLLLIHGTPSPL